MAPPTWAVDNIYIGPQCPEMCYGHGKCVNGIHCECDIGYSGQDCTIQDVLNPDFLKEDFEGKRLNFVFIQTKVFLITDITTCNKQGNSRIDTSKDPRQRFDITF